MSKEATIIQSFNEIKQQYEYSVKGYDVTESVKILLKRHKEEYDKEKKIFAGIDGYLEAQKEYQSQITDLEAKLAESEETIRLLKMSNDALREDNLDLSYNQVDNVYETATEMSKGWGEQYKQEIVELKQQLTEKEKEIEKYRNANMIVVGGRSQGKKHLMQIKIKELQNQTAIAELEKVKVKLNEEINNASVLLDPVEYEDYHELLGVIRGYKLSVDQIDNQINELKGKVEDE